MTLLAVAVEVQVAAVGAVGVATASALAAIPGVLAKRSSARLEDKLGEPNGKGNVVQMLERLLSGQTGQDNRLARIESRQHDHETRLSVVEARTSGCPARQDPPPPAA